MFGVLLIRASFNIFKCTFKTSHANKKQKISRTLQIFPDQVSVPLVLHTQNPKFQWMGSYDRTELDTIGGTNEKMWVGLLSVESTSTNISCIKVWQVVLSLIRHRN